MQGSMMKQILGFLICVVFLLPGCALIPSKDHLAKKDKPAHKHSKEHKLAQHHKADKKHRSLKDKIQLVDFKLFDKDKPKPKHKKHHKKRVAPEATGTVMTFFSPLGGQLIEIPREGEGLGNFLIEHELEIALLNTQAIKRKEEEDNQDDDENDDDQKDDEKKGLRFLNLRPDVIVLQRGPVATFFPRAMLGIPQIANLPVHPNDSLITLDVVNNNLNVQNDETGEHSLLSGEVDFDNNDILIKKQYNTTGYTNSPGSNFTKLGETTVNLVAGKYSKDLTDDASAVVVIYRQYHGQFIRILLPNPKTGRFGRPREPEDGTDEAKKQAIQKAQEKWDENWNYYYENFKLITIQEGDVIEFTTLDRLDLTSPLNAALLLR